MQVRGLETTSYAYLGATSYAQRVPTWMAVARESGVTERPAKGLLTGDHLIAAGMAPGPKFKPILASALSAQDDGAFEDEAGALEWLRSRH